MGSLCSDGSRKRGQYVTVAAQGAGGNQCPELQQETEDCVDCVLDWEEWNECEDGSRSRVQIVVVEQKGAGKMCPEMKSESQVCIDCVVTWSAWSASCSDSGFRFRNQEISV